VNVQEHVQHGMAKFLVAHDAPPCYEGVYNAGGRFQRAPLDGRAELAEVEKRMDVCMRAGRFLEVGRTRPSTCMIGVDNNKLALLCTE
jgi:hypothetical protein